VSIRLTGDVSITCHEVKILLAADNAKFVLTLTADPGNVKLTDPLAAHKCASDADEGALGGVPVLCPALFLRVQVLAGSSFQASSRLGSSRNQQ
jgi:hypothetical protein